MDKMNTRYDFGRNWSDLAARLDHHHLEEAKRNLARLAGDVKGLSFLDLGCGSGLHSAAALALGATNVHALDYDPICVATTKSVLERFVPDKKWIVERADALSPGTLPKERFDVVYSWGVLHHTGDMWRAIRNVVALVGPNGRFCVALYVATPFCRAWQIEKRLYSKHKWLRPLIKWPYVAGLLLRKQIAGRNGLLYIRNYRNSRGMEFMSDVDDWLGGYPYESISPPDLIGDIKERGFRLVYENAPPLGTGFFGTGCGEWCFEAFCAN
jgi:2-polyprenyl-6-hydroxyphenyl methylase/3-demethylubiquinone-9 3-methyltransferase